MKVYVDKLPKMCGDCPLSHIEFEEYDLVCSLMEKPNIIFRLDDPYDVDCPLKLLPQGRWNRAYKAKDDCYEYICSECGNSQDFPTDYCPICGSKNKW